MRWTLRRAGPADAERIGAMGVRCFNETFDDVPQTDLLPWLDKTFGEGLLAELQPESDRAIAFVEDGGAVAGFVKLAPMTLPIGHESGAAEIKQLYVLKDWQGSGVAAALMDWALAEARTRAALAVYLSVYAHNHRAIAFYRRFGFEQVGTAPFVIGAHVDIDPVLRADLAIDPNRSGALRGLAHGFLGRRGGVSTGIHGGLNVGLGSDDDRGSVEENRGRATHAVLPGATLVTLHQVHSPTCVVATAAWPDDARPHADALVTDRPGLLLGILTADCAPILLADAEAGVIGAAHAGWKGALAGVTDSVVAEMERLGARRERIAAAIGPCIGRTSYEVDDAFARRFETVEPANERFFRPGRDGHHQFDLEAYVAARLAAAGVTRVDALGVDTYADADRFFSFRRATHRNEPDYGRQIALIGLRP